MRPEDKDAADNQMSPKGQKGAGNYTKEDASGIPDKVGNEPDTKGYTSNVNSVPTNKSRGTGAQINNGALSAADASGGDGTASAIAKVTKVSGDKVDGMNFGPSIGRFDNPPAALKSTGTQEAVSAARKAIEDRFPGTDTDHIDAANSDRNWR